MILSDREIRAALRRGSFRISPTAPDQSDLWSSTSLDLRLDAKMHLWEAIQSDGLDTTVCPEKKSFNATNLILKNCKSVDCTNGFVLKPGMFVLGWTIEKIQFPHASRIAGRVEGKSSLARLGIGVHVTAPTVHAGFGYKPDNPTYLGSPLQLEIWNIGKLDVKLTYELPVCQLIFEEVHGTPDKAYEGQFTEQGPDVDPPKKTARKPAKND